MAIASKYLVLFNAGLKTEELEAACSSPHASTENWVFPLGFSKDDSRTVLASIGNGMNPVFCIAQAYMGASEF